MRSAEVLLEEFVRHNGEVHAKSAQLCKLHAELCMICADVASVSVLSIRIY